MHRILLIDDDQDLLLGVSRLLKKNNFQVSTLPGGQNIHEEIKFFNPDLIILDILLAEEDGRDICIQLKENPATKGIKIILYSAFSDTKDSYEIYGADGFILKPFGGSHLIEAINFHLNSVTANS